MRHVIRLLTILFVGIALYSKIIDRPVQPWLIAAGITFIVSLGLTLIADNLSYNPDGPKETSYKLMQVLEVEPDEITVSYTAYFGEFYKDYNFDKKARMRVNNDESKVLDIYFFDIEDESVIEVLNDLNYPITNELIETLEQDKGVLLNKEKEVGVLIRSRPLDKNDLKIIYDPQLYEIEEKFY
ncbi:MULTISPECIES: hypothetical protein [Aerococcus]|uniref:hypothetical protein n=1 Tax=Aerococcus TaxID=1375 RepID=UPI000DCE7B63|nr:MULTISPECIES: hypothetical protein [Aerococcus]KAA9231691.1 hypothetical protein F6I37_08730 [Aerococcus mictus]MDK6290895.1 hypothetical protein [Aerococcus urinae]MDK6374736.1 hypothetical protein [Aerococcus urinae]MDK6420239.1 hypothetical protein [Aerococcus urinae]MDK8074611.1 hypothetical protein [Aerococcus urinae]